MSLEITTATDTQKKGIREALEIFVILYGSGDPIGADGIVGDSYIDEDAGKLFKKTGATTWTLKGHIAKSVSDSQVTFVTPTAGDGTAELATP